LDFENNDDMNFDEKMNGFILFSLVYMLSQIIIKKDKTNYNIKYI